MQVVALEAGSVSGVEEQPCVPDVPTLHEPLFEPAVTNPGVAALRAGGLPPRDPDPKGAAF